METWVDSELENWARWANSGPSVGPQAPSSCLDNICMREFIASESADYQVPALEERALKVQKVYDGAVFIERKVMQAEYLSPWKYRRHAGIQAAANTLQISVPSYETVLSIIKRRVEGVFA